MHDTAPRQLADAVLAHDSVTKQHRGQAQHPVVVQGHDGGDIDSQHGRPPKGMTKEAWKAMVADYDTARDAWSKAAGEISRATFEASVTAARDAKAKIASIMESLGVEVKAS